MYDITPIFEAVAALIAALITAFVIPYIKSKTTAEQQKEINAWVKIAVAAAETVDHFLFPCGVPQYDGIGQPDAAHVRSFDADEVMERVCASKMPSNTPVRSESSGRVIVLCAAARFFCRSSAGCRGERQLRANFPSVLI